MLLGQDPGFKREPRSVRSQREEVLILCNHASASLRLLPNYIAKHATLFVDVVLLGAFQLLDHVDGKNRQSNQLRVRMFQRRSGSLSMILENQDVLEPPVLLQIKNSVAEGPKHIFDSFWRQRREAGAVVGSLNNDFVGAHSIHPVEHALSLPAEAALYP